MHTILNTIKIANALVYKFSSQTRPLFGTIFVFSHKVSISAVKNTDIDCAWDLNLGLKEGKHKRIHWAMAANICWCNTQAKI